MKKQDLELKTALYKLVFFEPNLKDEKDNQVLDYLILDCLSTYSPMLECRINEIQKYIKTTFYIDFDDAEILNGTKRLQSKSLVAISDPDIIKYYPFLDH